MDILGPDRGKMTIYGSDFQQVNLTPNGGISPTDRDRIVMCQTDNYTGEIHPILYMISKTTSKRTNSILTYMLLSVLPLKLFTQR